MRTQRLAGHHALHEMDGCAMLQARLFDLLPLMELVPPEDQPLPRRTYICRSVHPLLELLDRVLHRQPVRRRELWLSVMSPRDIA